MHREHKWRQKLQGEPEVEWQEINGQLQNDASHEAQELESSAWSDHLAQEHVLKCQQQPEAKGAAYPHGLRQEEKQWLLREQAKGQGGGTA